MVFALKISILTALFCLSPCFANVPQHVVGNYQYIPAQIHRQEGLGAGSAAALGSGLNGLNSLLNLGSGLGSSLTGILPDLVQGVTPLLFMLGLGALLLPVLGFSLFRENIARTFNEINPSFIDGLNDLFIRVTKALDNVEKKYN